MIDEDVIIAKIATVKKCLSTISKITQMNPDKLNDIFIQDVFVLNLQRAVQASLDIANTLISKLNLEMPTSYKNCFQILATHNIIEKPLMEKMINMVGFRNIAVHDYQSLDPEILKSILSHHLNDLEDYIKIVHTKYIKA